MGVPIVQKQAALEMAAHFIYRQHPTTVGIAFMELDCGCLKLCGVAPTGATVASMSLALDKTAVKRDRPPVCRVCADDKGVNIQRLLFYGIAWFTRKGRRPPAAQRQELGRKLFGSDYANRNDSFLDI